MDIVTELKQGAYTDSLDDKLMKRAADEIERLRAALRHIIAMDESTDYPLVALQNEARKALNEQKPAKDNYWPNDAELPLPDCRS